MGLTRNAEIILNDILNFRAMPHGSHPDFNTRFIEAKRQGVSLEAAERSLGSDSINVPLIARFLDDALMHEDSPRRRERAADALNVALKREAEELDRKRRNLPLRRFLRRSELKNQAKQNRVNAAILSTRI